MVDYGSKPCWSVMTAEVPAGRDVESVRAEVVEVKASFIMVAATTYTRLWIARVVVVQLSMMDYQYDGR